MGIIPFVSKHIKLEGLCYFNLFHGGMRPMFLWFLVSDTVTVGSGAQHTYCTVPCAECNLYKESAPVRRLGPLAGRATSVPHTQPKSA